MKNKETDRFFIAIVPEEPVFHDLHQFKLEAATHFSTSGALKSPPHLTLHMPFLWKKKKLNQLKTTISNFASQETGFEIELNNFNQFPPRVIFVDVKQSMELSNLQTKLKKMMKRELNLFNADYKERPFRPHFTIAFRDLKKAIFPEAWNFFKEKQYTQTIQVKYITLLKHDGNVWEVYEKFHFDG
ncbi:2'-5' RNA ligase family protein [Persicobacter diffluens]|uniref:2'-5' RNA ligase n=1 Tax=Persicobacter diffluens TaxID=981 RepID=A0AAN5AKH8_9BACT|nr:2'-5' RNA ligase [Persicobacter diffluens]